MGGYAEEKKDKEISALGRNELKSIIEQERSRIPPISRKSILVRGRLDTLCKFIAVMQIFSFCMGCLLRWINDLSLSILEVSTMGHSVCAVLAYMLWWEKPHSIMTEPTMIHPKQKNDATIVESTDVREKEEVCESDNCGALSSLEKEKGGLQEKAIRRLLRKVASLFVGLGANQLSTSSIEMPKDLGEFVVMIVGCISPALYGLLHLLAWSGKFPTPVELILWRISTIAVTASGIIAGIGLFIFLSLVKIPSVKKQQKEQIFQYLLIPFLSVVLLFYVLARCFMIVEAFRQLLCLPDDAYIVASWSKYIPQIS